jgi:PAS domain S-box-containing protein
MQKKPISIPADTIFKLKILAEEKESVRRKLVVTADKLRLKAKQLAITAEEKESVRRKLAVTAKQLKITAREKESVRQKLAVTAEQLRLKAKQLAVTAEEKESVRRKLVVTAEKLVVTAKEKENVRQKLVITAEQLKITAREKESVRQKLAITAEQLSLKAKQLAITAEEKESVRRKLVVTAEKLVVTAREKESVRRELVGTAKKLRIKARQLAITAKEKESVRRKLAITAGKLKKSRETLERKVIERTKSLEMARAKEEAILHSIGDGLIATDEKGQIILINKTAEKLLEKESKNVMGKIFSETIRLEDEYGTSIPQDRHPVSMALLGNKISTRNVRETLYHARKDKSRFPLAIMVTPVTLEKKVIGTIKVFRDITNEHQIDRAKTEFVSLASHQLRTPLSTVSWYTEMLLEGNIGCLNEKQKKYLTEVYHGNQRMIELVNALLDVSRLELGTFTIEPKPTDMVRLAKSVIHEQTPQIDIRKIELSFSPEKIPIINADPKLVRMIIQNILSNAIKYTPDGGKVKVSISLANKKNVLFKVTDNGYGIPKNQQDKIFTKLFRADNVREKDTDGTGLGLYIVKSVVENSGGKIWFESTKEKPGTTFFVTLPIKNTLKAV